MKPTNTIALVLCAGDALRMGGVKKQLLPIGKTTVLGRILHQLYERKQQVILVTHDTEIGVFHDRVHNPENRKTTCNTLLSTAHLWDDRTVVLLGDVIYSGDVLDEVLDCYEPIQFFGNTGEIFAIVFDKTNHKWIKDSLRKGSGGMARVRSDNEQINCGKLRHFYHAYCGYPVGNVKTESLINGIFRRTHDWTMDVDTPHEYNQVQLNLVDTGVIEELPI